MNRSRLETRFFKTRSASDRLRFKKQKKYVSRLYKKERKAFYENLNIKMFLDNKSFWKNMKPLFSEKSFSDNITLFEGDKIITDEKELASVFNNFFENSVRNSIQLRITIILSI